MTDTTIVDDDQYFLEKIDTAISKAANVMELGDVYDGGEPDDDSYEDVWEARHHCGTCQVRTVMETVWPAIEDYIEHLKSRSSN
jgi:hypothetical protein